MRTNLHSARTKPLRTALASILVLVVAEVACASDAADRPTGDPLLDGFRDPPASARPRVWWHWMNGNITKAGIAEDLAWMKRVGIGGLQNFDANQATPQIVPHRLVYMTPDWKDAFRFAAETADRLDLELTIASSPGWSETGGPWVPPSDGMKKLVWSETQVEGGRRFTGRLTQPPSTTGAYRDLPAEEDPNQVEGKHVLPVMYADAAVLAYRAPIARPLPVARMTSADGKAIDAAALIDDSEATAVTIAPGEGSKPAIVSINYDAPQTIRSATLFAPGSEPGVTNTGLHPRLEMSADGATWRAVAEFALTAAPTTVSFSPVIASRFRIVFAPASAPGGPSGFALPAGVDLSAMGHVMRPSSGLKIVDLRLSGAAVVDQFETKAGFSTSPDYFALGTVPDVPGSAVAPTAVVDLTARMRPDGSLDWTAPRGDWRVLRLGWSLIGKLNHPATDAATGLEVDKLDPAAVRRYLEHYLAMYRETTGANLMGAHGVRALVNDSTEVGAFNWTPDMISAFTRLRGYDPTPWLPALTGVIVGSRGQSDAFLYDFRRTIADLHASAHYGTISAVAHENGLKTYGEALESARPSLGDDMAMRRHADYPMAAMWFIPPPTPPRAPFLADLKGASSVAHVYGQNIAAAESMTSILFPWGTAPSDLRQTIDLEFAYGINRPVIHTSVHQPVDDKIPGLSLGVFGQYFNRHETWAEMAKPWIDYIARNAFILQQGRNVADVAYFFGEEAPLTSLYNAAPVADAPRRYAYDFVNPDAVMNRLSVLDGDLMTPGGARYRLLYLGGSSRRMTLPMLRRVAELAEAGATVVGAAPEGSPALGDDPAAYRALVTRLWTSAAVTPVGKGRVIAGRDVEAALAMIGATPDFEPVATSGEAPPLFVHRLLDDGDAYFIDNRADHPVRLSARFRVSGKAPALWHADTGLTESASYRSEGDRTLVDFDLETHGSVFVIFREVATGPSLAVARPTPTVVTSLSGPWDVAFQAGRGAPPTMRLPELAPLNEQADAGVRYFSGIATYTRDFVLPEGAKPGSRLLLDLGKVGDLAEVTVNGTVVGTAWHAPYRLDIGAAVHSGRNRMTIRVADLWVNRLIGDKQPGAKPITYTSGPTYTANAPLRPSGLIGPVTLMR